MSLYSGPPASPLLQLKEAAHGSPVNLGKSTQIIPDWLARNSQSEDGVSVGLGLRVAPKPPDGLTWLAVWGPTEAFNASGPLEDKPLAAELRISTHR